MRVNTGTAAAVLLLCLASAYSCSRAQVLHIIDPWLPPLQANIARSYPPVNATCGDTLEFVWSGQTHSVFRPTTAAMDPANATATCPETFDNKTGQELAPRTNSSRFNYTVPIDTLSFWMVGPVDGHCEDGQKVLINVTCPEATVIPAVAVNASMAGMAMNDSMSGMAQAPAAGAGTTGTGTGLGGH